MFLGREISLKKIGREPHLVLITFKLSFKLLESISSLSEKLTLPNKTSGVLSLLHILCKYSPVKFKPLISNFPSFKVSFKLEVKEKVFEICQHWWTDQSKRRKCKDLWDRQIHSTRQANEIKSFHPGFFYGKMASNSKKKHSSPILWKEFLQEIHWNLALVDKSVFLGVYFICIKHS